MSKPAQALNAMQRNDFRLATASAQPNAVVPWRQRAAEAARAAAEPYLAAQRHLGHTVPALQRQAALEALEEAPRMRQSAEELKTKAKGRGLRDIK